MTEKDDQEDSEVLLPISPMNIVTEKQQKSHAGDSEAPGSTQLFWLLVWMAKYDHSLYIFYYLRININIYILY